MKLSFDTELRDLGLWELLAENKFTDMVLLTRDRKINAHSAILTHFCPPLGGLIKNHFSNFEDVIISVPDTSGDAMSKSLEDVYVGKNCDELSLMLGLRQDSIKNDMKTELKLEEGLERFLAGLPVKVVLKNESDSEDDSEGEDDVPELDDNSNCDADDANHNGTSDTDLHNYTSDVPGHKVNYIGHDLNYIQSLPESKPSLKLKIVTSREKLVFKCDQCANTFSSKALLTKHSHQVHWENYGYSALPNNIVVCSANKGTCLEVFLSKELLDDHRRLVHTENSKIKAKTQKYQCEECGKQISSPECLRLHVDAIHRGIKHPCPHCPYSTGWPKNLDEHILFYHTHVNDESILKYQCSICGKKFKRQNSLAEHELTHNPKTFKCSHCKRGFSHDRYLERHILSVHGDKKFPCEICGKKFTTQEYVKTHYNSVHLEHSERRHKCDICGQGFNKKMAFRSHMNKHQGLKPFLCPAPQCEKCFSDDTAWSHHKRSCSFMKSCKENPPVQSNLL